MWEYVCITCTYIHMWCRVRMYNIHIQYNKYNSSLFASQIYCQWLTATNNQLYPHNTHTYSAKLSVNVISMEANQHHPQLHYRHSLSILSIIQAAARLLWVWLLVSGVGVPSLSWCLFPEPFRTPAVNTLTMTQLGSTQNILYFSRHRSSPLTLH